MGENPPGSTNMLKKNLAPNIKEVISLISELEEPANKELHDQLSKELIKARTVLKIEEEKERLKALHLDSSVMRTLRQIRLPKKQVLDITIAFLLLLGEYEGDTRVCFHYLDCIIER